MAFTKIEIQRPATLIMLQIREQLASGELQPGQKLPSEARLQQLFNVSRFQVHEAVVKLEHYGIIRTKPQSGTYIADMSREILTELISNVAEGQDILDPIELIEARDMLEKEFIKLVIKKASDVEIASFRELHNEFVEFNDGRQITVEIDVQFHLKLAQYSGNQVLRSLYCNLIPDILIFSAELEKRVDNQERVSDVEAEHLHLLEAIENRDTKLAVHELEEHLTNIKNIAVRVGLIERE